MLRLFVGIGFPPELKLRQGTGKYIFKRALGGLLPAHILNQPKRGFAVPLGRWFRRGEFVRELLLSETARQRGLINQAYVEKLLKRNEGGRDLDFHLWMLISFELWAQRFLDEARWPSPRPALEGEPLVVGPAVAKEAMRA